MKDELGPAMADAKLWLLKATSDLDNAMYRHGTGLAKDEPMALENLQAAFENAKKALAAMADIPCLAIYA